MNENVIERLNVALTGRYRVERKLGEGGMATVYLADDLRHERKVALKVLKPELAAVVGAERFLAEIKTTANLQHPHILPLFDSGEADSFLFYVMPFIEGETLRDRLDRERQLPIDEALGIATAVANALQAAHEAGIVHRDIKPANILLSRGEPLVADFGIALAVGAAAGGNRLTETGLSVGTPYYMSPEQATGDQVVGAASDIFALACVLYEMLVGEPPYPGSTAQAVLGKIIQGVPVSATAVRKTIPFNVDAAIRKALEKLPADRFTGANQFAKALADPAYRHGTAPGGAEAAGSGKWKRVALGVSGVTVALAAGLAFILLRPATPEAVERFALLPLEGQATNYEFDLSDDGSSVVLTLTESGVSRLAVRRLGELAPAPIAGTEQAFAPVVSPDGTEVAFIAGSTLKVAPIRGGVVRTLTDSAFCCTRWAEDGNISYSTNTRTIARVPSAGGPVESLTTIAGGEDGQHGDFELGPDGDVAVFTVWGSPFRVEAIRLSTGERKVVTPGMKPFLVDGRYLIFGSIDGQVLAARFDAKTMALDGPAVPLVDGVRVDGDNYPYFSVARNGTLLYWTGPSTAGNDGRVVRVDRAGNVIPVDPGWLFNPGTPEVALAVSPDGKRLAVKITSDGNDDIWVKQLDQGPLSRLTFDEGTDRRPRWSRDGRSITYNSSRKDGSGYDLWTQPADGTGSPEVLLDLDGSILEVQVTPDGSDYLLRLGGTQNVFGVRDIVSVHKGETELKPIAAESYDEKAVALSPDGKWVAYESTETGRDEIYVRPYPNAQSGKWQVSTSGGINPKWAHSGRELFYVNGAGEMTAAEVNTQGGAFEVANWRTLFNVPERGLDALSNYASWDVDVDDQHFLMIQFGGGEIGNQRNEFVLVQNWLQEVRARLGG